MLGNRLMWRAERIRRALRTTSEPRLDDRNRTAEQNIRRLGVGERQTRPYAAMFLLHH